MNHIFTPKTRIIIFGLIFGSLGALAANWGNPPNMGLCVAGFVTDTAGALGLHRLPVMAYIRPEIIGFTLGAAVSALVFREWKPRGGATPLIRFTIGFFIMVGALVFLGCPVRTLLRIAGGDLNAIIGLAGIVFGIRVGVYFLRHGFNLGRSTGMHPAVGAVMPIIMGGLLIFAVIKPDFISYSDSGPGALHAPFAISLALGLVTGVMVQRTRLCFMGAWRDLFLARDFYLFSGIAAFFIAALVTNYVVHNFGGIYHWGFLNQPLAHSDYLWNFMGMGLVGVGAAEVGGCPLRNLILSGEGDTDAGAVVLGFFAGAALASNFLVVSSPEGVSALGPAAVIAGWVFCISIGFLMRTKLSQTVM
ncbi:MAG: YedE family putative selenium transporter [Chloroflexota bacterium]